VAHKEVFDDLRDAFAASDADIGLLATAFIVPHALVTLPLSWLGDRVDRRRVIAVGLVCWSLAACACALSWSMNSLLLFRAAVGAATASCVPMANALLCDIIAPERRARTIAVFNLGLFFGGVVGIAAGGVLGFPWAFVAVGAPGLVVALLVLGIKIQGRAIAPRAPVLEARPGVIAAISRVATTFGRDAAAVISVRPLRWMMLGAVLMAFAAGAYVHWFIEFLIDIVGLTEKRANALYGVLLIGGLIGVITGGLVADWIYQHSRAGRQIAVAAGMGLAVPCAVAALYLDAGPVFYVAAFLLVFFINWYHGPIAAAVDDLVPPERAATAQGTYIAIMHLFGTAPAPWLVGVLTDRGSMDLRQALMVPTAAVAGAALCFAVSAAVLRR
jgi:MFS family permease